MGKCLQVELTTRDENKVVYDNVSTVLLIQHESIHVAFLQVTRVTDVRISYSWSCCTITHSHATGAVRRVSV